MGIAVLPPDINESLASFSVSDGAIRYALAAIRSVGRPLIEGAIAEREANGPYRSLEDFIERMAGKDLNTRAIENFIKAGAFDSLPGNRRQFMQVYKSILDAVNRKRKTSMEGQISLFDLADETEKERFEIRLPEVEEYGKEDLLAMEKEVLGIYLSGHPLEEYEARWRKNITNVTTDFVRDEETGEARVADGASVMVGGMIAGKTVKYTKNNQAMAFLTIEDLYGTVEVIVFPRDYERYGRLMEDDAKVFLRGRVSLEDEKDGKVICERMYSFDEGGRELWIRFADKEAYKAREEELLSLLADSDGTDPVVVYLTAERAAKRLGENRAVSAEESLLAELAAAFGEENVSVAEKSVEKR